MNSPFEIQTAAPPSFQAAHDLLKWALYYGGLGWRIIPTHFATPRGCSCKNGSRCPEGNIGKHPVLTGWQKHATSDLRQIERWWRGKFRGHNIGLLTGPESGVIVIDIDDDEAAYIVAERGLPPGPVAITGRGGAGRHYFLAHPGYHIKNKSKPYPGMDIRGDGGFLVLPPSLHRLGTYYQWEVSP